MEFLTPSDLVQETPASRDELIEQLLNGVDIEVTCCGTACSGGN